MFASTTVSYSWTGTYTELTDSTQLFCMSSPLLGFWAENWCATQHVLVMIHHQACCCFARLPYECTLCWFRLCFCHREICASADIKVARLLSKSSSTSLLVVAYFSQTPQTKQVQCMALCTNPYHFKSAMHLSLLAYANSHNEPKQCNGCGGCWFQNGIEILLALVQALDPCIFQL